MKVEILPGYGKETKLTYKLKGNEIRKFENIYSPRTSFIIQQENEEKPFSEFVQETYKMGATANKELTTEQNYSVARDLIAENTEVLLDSVNNAYLQSQMLADIGDIEVNEADQEGLADVVDKIVAGDEYKGDTYNDLPADLRSAVDNIAANKDNYKQYADASEINPSEISSEVIDLMNFNDIDPEATLYLPSTASVVKDYARGDAVQSNITFESQVNHNVQDDDPGKNGSERTGQLRVDLNEIDTTDMTEEEKQEAYKTAITDALAKNYGLTYIDENGEEQTYDLNSYAGNLVRDALEENNDAIFNDVADKGFYDEGKASVDSFVDTLVTEALQNEGYLYVNCPDINASILTTENEKFEDIIKDIGEHREKYGVNQDTPLVKKETAKKYLSLVGVKIQEELVAIEKNVIKYIGQVLSEDII